jgi:hypothetical protein
VLSDRSRGALAGEGSAFFVLSSKPGNKTYGKIRDLLTLFSPGPGETEEVVLKMTGAEKPDLIIFGISGDPATDKFYEPFRNRIFRDTPQLYYKHLSGEYHTASAFSLWLAARILETQKVPATLYLNDVRPTGITNILLYNHYRNINHSFILVSRP